MSASTARLRIDETEKVLGQRESKTSRELTTMQTRIRIIKRGEDGSTSSPSPNQVERTARQSERETANTVKSWIAEWEARNRAARAAAFSLLRSLENGSENSTRRFAVVNG